MPRQKQPKHTNPNIPGNSNPNILEKPDLVHVLSRRRQTLKSHFAGHESLKTPQDFENFIEGLRKEYTISSDAEKDLWTLLVPVISPRNPKKKVEAEDTVTPPVEAAMIVSVPGFDYSTFEEQSKEARMAMNSLLLEKEDADLRNLLSSFVVEIELMAALASWTIRAHQSVIEFLRSEESPFVGSKFVIAEDATFEATNKKSIDKKKSRTNG